MSGDDLAQAALKLVGRRFRLHGCESGTEVDCIGAVAAALAAIGHPVLVPNGYGLRLARPDERLRDPGPFGLVDAVESEVRSGEILVTAPGPGQLHFSIEVTGPAHVHAHAGLRRVVQTPGLPSGHLLHLWRLPAQGI